MELVSGLTDGGVHSVAHVQEMLIAIGLPADVAAQYLIRLAAAQPGSVLPVRRGHEVALLIRPEPGSGGQLRLLVAGI